MAGTPPSYITGAHSLKVGYWGFTCVDPELDQQRQAQYRFSGGVPNQLTMSGNPFLTVNWATPSAVYVQDQSTFGRLTLQGGLRFDYASSSYPDQQVGPEKFIPTAIMFPASSGTAFKDLTPRIGATYDVFGNGKTAIKVSLGKYLEAASDSTGSTDQPPGPSAEWTTGTELALTDSITPGQDNRERR